MGNKTGSTPSISCITSVFPNRTASSSAVEKLESWKEEWYKGNGCSIFIFFRKQVIELFLDFISFED